LIIFLPFLVFSAWAPRAPETLVYFFIQRVAGLLLFSFFIIEFSSQSLAWKEGLLLLMFLFKLGGFPLHGWVVSLASKIKWERVFIILTVQKFLPIYILTHFLRRGLLKLVRIRFTLLAIQALKAKTLKVLIVVSSIFFIMAILGRIGQSNVNWVILLLVYSLLFMPLVNLGGGESIFSLGGRSMINRRDLSIWLFLLLRLRGVPLLPGFFLKLEFLLIWLKRLELFMLATFLMGSVGFIYLYISVLLHLVSKTGGLVAFSRTRFKIPPLFLVMLTSFLVLV